MNPLDSVQERGSREGRDSSEHSYTLDEVKIKPQDSDTPFGALEVQKEETNSKDSMERLPSAGHTERLLSPLQVFRSPQGSLREAFTGYRERMLHGRRSSVENRPSAERRPSMGTQGSVRAESIPPGVNPGMFVAHEALGGRRTSKSNMRISLDLGPHRLESLDNAKVEGRLVKRRNRLPVPVVLFFGLMSVYAAIMATATLGIGIYNMSKLKAARAARTVDALRNEIEPQLLEILSILRGFVKRK